MRSTKSFAFSRSVVNQSSFTLIELLIVIGILAVLVAAVVVVLNPAQLLAQARDAQRMQDISSLNQALNTALALDPGMFTGATGTIYTSLPDSATSCASWSLPLPPTGWQYHCVGTSTLADTDGTGWIPVNLKANGAVSLDRFPVDPINTSATGLFYTYTTGGSFELTAKFESAKYQQQEINDGGAYSDAYEAGSAITLVPFDVHIGSSLPGGLAAYWPLNESTGTVAYDGSGSGLNGMWSSPQFGPGHNWSSAASLTGSNSINLNAANPITGNAFTITAWINVASGATGNNYVITKGGDGSCGPSYGIDAVGSTNGFVISFMTAESVFQKYWVATNATYPYGQWQFIAVTMSSSDIGSKLIYVNGTLASSTVYSGSEGSTSEPITASTLGLYIGQQACGLAYNFRGLINDVRAYNKTLSPSEIWQVYSSGH